MNTTEEILVIANKLADEGKKPSVALIKTQLTQTVPLPTIIGVLRNWQHQPNYSAKAITATKQNEINDKVIMSKTELNDLIQQVLKPITQELQEIKQWIKQHKS
ncbi:MAG: hypothetical protein JKX78_04745 [Alteromonadaceae bacterium]|nr:hypothetical protein [Alteromonadaceae bacterium]